jgi:hypothetical protein
MSSSLSIKTHPAYLIYDLSSPYFVSSEITTIFSPAPIAADLTSRISDITSRSSSLSPIALCVGEYTSASLEQPSTRYGFGQIFPGWKLHPATKRFEEMIADTPVIQPYGRVPALILKGLVDEFNGDRDPGEITWVLRFLLMPKEGMKPVWEEVCKTPERVEEKEWKQVLLVGVNSDGFRMEELRRRVTGFGKLFAVDVEIVASLGCRRPVGGG